MNRRSFLTRTAASAASALLLPSLSRAASASRARRKPNLIVFLPDQQRSDTLATYPSPYTRCHSPNLTKLASQSVIFDRCYVTYPLCTPSRSSLLTGTWPHQNGCTSNNLALAARWKAFPEMLGDADYRTGYLGKWHLGDEVFAQRGFEEWASIEDMYQEFFSPGRDRKAITDYSKFLRSQGLTPDAANGSFSRGFASKLPMELSKPRFLQNHACDFIARHARDPFVLFVSFLEPHSPYYGPLNEEHSLDDVELEPSARRSFGADMPLHLRLRQEAPNKGGKAEQWRVTKQRYLGNITSIDRAIGAILAKLDDLNLVDDTIVVHTSDHGDMMGAHQFFEKNCMFEPASRVPYLIRMPGQARSRRVAQQVSHIDFAPTLLDLLGAPVHAQCVGRSRAPLIRGESMPSENVFMELGSGTAGTGSAEGGVPFKPGTKLATPIEIDRVTKTFTRTTVSPDRWKLNLRDADKGELYDLSSDPLETENLYGRAAFSDRQKMLTADIQKWQECTGDEVAL